MALKKTLAERLFNLSKMSSQALTNCRISSTSRISKNPTQTRIAPDPGDNKSSGGIFRRFLHKGAIVHPKLSPLAGETLLDKIKTVDIAKDRIRLDGLTPPPHAAAEEEERKAVGLTVEETKKLLKAFQLEMVKERLRAIENSWIPYPEFIRVCQDACPDPELGSEFAKLLDESGSVIVLGKMVFLQPEQVNLQKRPFQYNNKYISNIPCLIIIHQ